MKLLPLILTFVIQSNVTSPKPDVSTPESSVRGLVAAYIKMDILRASEFVYGAKLTADQKASFKEQPPQLKELVKALSTFKITDLKSEINGNGATVTLSASADGGDSIKEKVPLRREGTSWKVVGFDVKNIGSQDSKVMSEMQMSPVRTLATMFNLLPVFSGARDKAREVGCKSHLKQITTGGLMYLQDFDEKFAFKAAEFKKVLFPYLKNNTIFHCPSDKPDVDSYSFNANLQGSTLARVKRPAETVMVYEGANGILNFRHAGSANVGFVDGHVKLINKEQAKKLVWKP